MLEVRIAVAFGEGERRDWKRSQSDVQTWGCLHCCGSHYGNSLNYTLIIRTHFCVYAISYLKVCCFF